MQKKFKILPGVAVLLVSAVFVLLSFTTDVFLSLYIVLVLDGIRGSMFAGYSHSSEFHRVG